MPARAVELGGRVYVRITLRGQDRKLGQWRGARVTGENAEFLASIINQQILSGLFRWDDWFPKDRKQYLVSELVPLWFDAKPRRPASIDGMKSITKLYLLPHLGEKDVRELSSLDFDWIKAKLGNSPQARSCTKTCQAFMNWCYKREIIPRKIFLPTITVPRKKTPYLTKEDQERILEGIPEPYFGPNLMSVEMGMRTGEILALRWPDIDRDCGGLTVNQAYSGGVIVPLPKEGVEKWLPIPARLQAYLSRKRAPFGWVFCHRSGTRVWPYQMTLAFKHSARDYGLPEARCHHNRNSLAINMLESGASLEEVGALLGHKHRTTTEMYTTWRKPALRKLRIRMEGRG